MNWCSDNICEEISCHRCFPRKDCREHTKCVDFTKRTLAFTDEELREFELLNGFLPDSSSCRTENCPGDALSLNAYDGYCPDCADGIYGNDEY